MQVIFVQLERSVDFKLFVVDRILASLLIHQKVPQTLLMTSDVGEFSTGIFL